MYDVADGKQIQIAVKMNRASIINAVKKCSDKDVDNWFWCRLVELSKDCQWLNGKPCHCIAHNGMSMLDTICVFVKAYRHTRFFFYKHQ